MAFELKQNLKLSQHLVMTPQLQQAIKLLQLSRLELTDLITQEMEENPLLEEVVSEEYPEDTTVPESDTVEIANREEVKTIERTEEITGEGDGKEEFDWNSYLEDYGPTGVRYDRKDDDAPSWDNMLMVKPSLTDHLMWQLKLSRITDAEMKIGEQIIGNLDNNGYLVASIEEIAKQEGVEESFVEGVLKKIQEFDPPGIAARDIKECLLIQARILGVLTPLGESIINEHLKDLETKNYSNISRKLKVPMSEVLQAVCIISSMDPKPGSVYTEERIDTITPDVYVSKAGEEYKIILNDDGLPKLRISNFYKEIMGGSNTYPDAENSRKYIRERMQSATWLIKSIQQRQRTIYKVTESILKLQRDFFNYGINYLKPLVLRDIADDVEMHESTISRVVTNKYMHTPRGIFELKYFFSSRIQKTSGDAVASKSVKEEIKKIVSAENPKKPYSDSDIVDLLKKSGISIARRTVAKYREMMRVLPSSKRKKYF
ncbi:MAG: RNA polymerase sigma-54 factor [Deltaproteobacteria bacterium]|nr:MAG: RNA polymerase sigma-54 factor [Deltaproteobacteria bacterium]